MSRLIIIFILANIANVIIQTVKSLCTVKCGKTIASIVNAVAYGFYTYIIILTTCELQTFTKAMIVGACNLVGVYVVKAMEEKLQKDKLWKIEATIPCAQSKDVANLLYNAKVSYNYLKSEGTGNYTLFNIFCNTKAQSVAVKEILKNYDAKYFVTESKTL